MQKVAWLKSIVMYPRGAPTMRKKSISAMPVTISAFSIGMLLNPSSMFCVLGFIAAMPSTASVPTTVAISAASMAMENVFTMAPIMSLLWKSSSYQCRLNPPHTDIDFVSLNESTISVSIGRYRKSITITM